MAEQQTFVIVGGGLAGARAAEAIRGEGFTGRVVIVAAEDAYPYIRPPLSKEYLQGGADRDSVFVHPADWYAQQDIEVLRGHEASALSPGSHELTLVSGEVRRYDKLLLATGATPRRFGGEGAQLPGVHYLRTVADSSALRAALSPGNRRVVVVGSGWIGLEVAATALGYGNSVTVLGHEPVPLAAAVGERVGHVFAGLHREHGVDLRSSTDVDALLGDARGVTGVRTASGDVVPADVVVLGIGVIPNSGLAEAAGLEVDNGIVTDASFQTTDADVYAVGDVASVYHPVLGRRIRIEHWANAENAGAAAGRAMAGAEVSYDEIPYFYTDQFDLGMEYSGYGVLAADAEVVFRGDVEGREFIAFWVKDSRVVAGMNVNVWDVNETVQRLIRERVPVDAARLQDESMALEDLLSPVGADEGN
ncbi:NAD(P)/FAD-dependent oxidoreductase [Cryobacterium tepidiphilum]|nr:FAD-dependent oxidoreductase [Cryobacterium tepidiphilum]